MNDKVLVAGASGGLGLEVLKKLKERNFYTRALIMGDDEREVVQDYTDDIVIGDATKIVSIKGIADGMDIVFSALGKSVSLFDTSEGSFDDIDYQANKNLVDDALKSKVERFVYVSIYGSDKFSDFELARAHRDVEQELLISGIGHTIVRPVGIFSGLLDVLLMAKKGLVVTVGDGENSTNPIHPEDLAEICVENMRSGKRIVEAGGPETFTRNQIAEMACEIAGCEKHIHLPELIADLGMPFSVFYDNNFFKKLQFFKKILTTDVIAPEFGKKRLRPFFEEKIGEMDVDQKKKLLEKK